MTNLESHSIVELIQAIAVITNELTTRGNRVRISYKNRKTSYSARIETLPFSSKIKTKKNP